MKNRLFSAVLALVLWCLVSSDVPAQIHVPQPSFDLIKDPLQLDYAYFRTEDPEIVDAIPEPPACPLAAEPAPPPPPPGL